MKKKLIFTLLFFNSMLIWSQNIEMVFVKSNTFVMGCRMEPKNDCERDEKPGHLVTVSDFYIGKYEVTQAQWRAIMGNNPSEFIGENLPVENVSWNDVQDFIRKLNEKTGKQYRLPTEAEWESAGKGGANIGDYKYSGSNKIGDVGWYWDNSGDKTYALGRTHPIGTKKSNQLDVYDMSGNVNEWCSDWYGEYNSSSQTDPKGPSSGSYRVCRGGSYHSTEKSVRILSRWSNSPNERSGSIGFRLACDAN
jgi:formylglycine-generating enzyme required for sulfatase activity